MKFTPFESEVLESILWQVEGLRIGRVTKRVTTRILRATIRRIRPHVIARSVAVHEDAGEIDHAIPIHVLCNRILSTPDLNRKTLEMILHEWLVAVELTRSEHREILKKCRLTSRMPHDWDGTDSLARYHAAGISLKSIDERANQSVKATATNQGEQKRP